MNKYTSKIRNMLSYIDDMQDLMFKYERKMDEASNKLEDYVLEHRDELNIPEHYRVVVTDGILKLYNPVDKGYDYDLVASWGVNCSDE